MSSIFFSSEPWLTHCHKLSLQCGVFPLSVIVRNSTSSSQAGTKKKKRKDGFVVTMRKGKVDPLSSHKTSRFILLRANQRLPFNVFPLRRIRWAAVPAILLLTWGSVVRYIFVADTVSVSRRAMMMYSPVTPCLFSFLLSHVRAIGTNYILASWPNECCLRVGSLLFQRVLFGGSRIFCFA